MRNPRTQLRRTPLRMTALSGLLVAGMLGGACGKSDEGPATGGGSQFDMRVAALNLENVNGVVYGVHVRTADGQTVWNRQDLDSTRFGDNVGSISYVGPCDATPSSNPHRIELVLHEMRSGPDTVIDPATYQNPAPVDDPIIVTATCVENADVPVTVNLTIMRNASQGFFDIGVTFDDIFCSAKFDCRRNGQPFDFLHNPTTEERDISVILGFACTAGEDAAGGGEPTWMHFSNIVVMCEDATGAEVTLLLDPSGPEGNNGGVPPLFYQTGIYRGQESLEPYDKCYWNMAFGVNLGADTGLTNCRLLAQGTASSGPFGPSGATPDGTVYPVIEWDISLTDETGALDCGAHALNGPTDVTYPDSSVDTTYTGWSGTSFTYEWECGTDTPVDPNALACAGLSELGTTAEIVPQAGGLTVSLGAAAPTSYYALPDGYTFGANTYCCINPCCQNQ